MKEDRQETIDFVVNQKGEQIYYRVAGEGQPLIFIHGWCMNSLVWSWQMKHLSKTNLVISLDMRGHGLSKETPGPYTIETFTEDLNLLIETLQLDSPIVIGWSMGSMVALNYVAKYGERVTGLILIGATSRFLKSESFPHGRHPARVKRLSENMKRDYDNYIRTFCQGFFATSEKIDKDRVETISRCLLNKLFPPPSEVAEDTLKELTNWRLPISVGSLNIPTLILHGEVDNIASIESAIEIYQIIPKSKMKVFKKSGHAPFLTSCDKFNQELDNFLYSLK